MNGTNVRPTSFSMILGDVQYVPLGVLVLSLRACILEYFKVTPWYNILKDYLFLMFWYKILSCVWFNIKIYGPIGIVVELCHCMAKHSFQWFLNSPIARKTVESQVKKVTTVIEKDIIKNDQSLQDFEILPKHGLSEEQVLNELDRLQKRLPYSHWEEGKVSGAVYHGGEDLIHLQSQAFEMYCVANQLHPDVFPGVRKMESEIVSMTLKLFHAPADTGCGTTTSGGTESLLLACLSAKMYALHEKGVTEPEMVVPRSAHAGFNKASYYFGIKLRYADLDPQTYQVDLKKVKKLINKNTVLLVGSAPNFPHGIVDDIQGLGKLSEKFHIPLHVDCCLGSFVVAFMEKAGFTDLPSFDFAVPGVTSISCDTHKYGFAPKGSSIIMYRSPNLRKYQYYTNSEWIGGLYGSPTLAGSRPGALVVGCWATMLNIGEQGYIESCREIITTARKLKKYIKANLPELLLIGDPKCSVISFTSKQINVHELADRLAKRGWHLSSLQKPAALHLAVTKLSVPAIDELLKVLTEEVKMMSKNADAKPSLDGTSAIYGVAGSVKTTGIADKLIVGFLDAMYKLKPSNA